MINSTNHQTKITIITILHSKKIHLSKNQRFNDNFLSFVFSQKANSFSPVTSLSQLRQRLSTSLQPRCNITTVPLQP